MRIYKMVPHLLPNLVLTQCDFSTRGRDRQRVMTSSRANPYHGRIRWWQQLLFPSTFDFGSTEEGLKFNQNADERCEWKRQNKENVDGIMTVLAAATAVLFHRGARIYFHIGLIVRCSWHGTHSVLDLCRHRHKCLLDIGGVLGAGF